MIIKTLLTKKPQLFHHSFLRFIITNTNEKNLKWRRLNDFKAKMPERRDDPIVTTVNTPEFQSIFTDELNVVRELFKKYNHELRVAGGAVRDILMGITPKDLDFATTATPTEMKDMFTHEKIRMINTNGERHGTITARINDKENFEITTLRIDVVTDGRHADIEFTTDWLLDANRRDLTINSMFLDFDGRIYDYFFGYDDLKKRRVVFVGDSVTRIREDFLRILRYFRFYGRISEYSDNHVEKTIQAIKDNVDGLARISGERIWMEWSKILEGNFSKELTIKMMECNIGKYIGLPEDVDMENFRKVCERAELNNIKLHPMAMVASMLRDTKQVLDLNTRLHLSVYNREMALFIVSNRNYDDPNNSLFNYQQQLLNNDKKKEIREYIYEVLKYQGKLDNLKLIEAWVPPKFPINGHDLKTHFDIPHQKLMGILISELKKVWLLDNCKTGKEDLMKHVPDILDNLSEKYKSLFESKKTKKQRNK